jgi:hypothetical protein
LIADVLHNLITCSWGAGTRSNRHCEIGGRNIEARQQDEKLKQKPAENSGGVKMALGLLCSAKAFQRPRLFLYQPQIDPSLHRVRTVCAQDLFHTPWRLPGQNQESNQRPQTSKKRIR